MASLLAHDQNGIERWQWLGFGLMSVDAVRDLAPVPGGNASVRLRRAGLSDIDEAVELSAGLARHLASSPTFVTDVDTRGKRFYEEWPAAPATALWLAHDGTRAVGCLASGPASEDASTIIRDPGTTSIFSAFTKAEARCRGVGTALLNRAPEWARTEAYERCAVDFEPMNTVGARFWMKRFQPVCYSLERRVG